MLTKYSQAQKRLKSGLKDTQLIDSTKMEVTSNIDTEPLSSRIQRKTSRACPTKRPLHQSSILLPARHSRRTPSGGSDDAAMDIGDNSNDSGLGSEHSTQCISVSPNSSVSLDQIMDDTQDISDMQPQAKRPRAAVKTETASNDGAEKRFIFPTTQQGVSSDSLLGIPLSGPVVSTTKDGKVSLSISAQPELQHRARYQTEGSRGAVKDRSGQGFPIVKLSGYNKAATLHIFIGSDMDRVSPHMFYQACRVCGKNSTPCQERKVEGTVVIELQLEPSKNFTVICDCVGILKERNVDVEHRFPEETVAKSKKKSTRCRMVFRTRVERPDGSWETLQVVSQSVACTQLPGVPEISKRSLTSSPCTGGAELFILGKNFLKDSRVVFQQPFASAAESPSYVWEQEVVPDKEFLQPNHLVCVVPPFHLQEMAEPAEVRVFVRSSGKCSEPQPFLYLPAHNNTVTKLTTNVSQQQPQQPLQNDKEHAAAVSHVNTMSEGVTIKQPFVPIKDRVVMPLVLPALLTTQQTKLATIAPNTVLMINQVTTQSLEHKKDPILPKKTVRISTTPRRVSAKKVMATSLIQNHNAGVKTISVHEDNLIRQFVSENSTSPLPAQSGSSVEKFLSKIENQSVVTPVQQEALNNTVSQCFTEPAPVDLPAVENLSITPQVLAPSMDVIFEKQKTTDLLNMKKSEQMFAIPGPEAALPAPAATASLPFANPMILTSVLTEETAPIQPQNVAAASNNVLNQPLLCDVPVQNLIPVQDSFVSAMSTPLEQTLQSAATTFVNATPLLVLNSSPPTTFPIESPIEEPKLSKTLPISINQAEYQDEAQLINSQLGQLLTTDLDTENAVPGLVGTNGDEPLVRDVLLGSVTAVVPPQGPPMHQLDTQVKKSSDPMLSQDLSQVSEKDLFCYFSSGCYEQVLP